MQKLYSSMPTNNFKMLAILYNDKPEVADKVVAKYKYTFPILIDPGNKTGTAYGLTGVPETYIIDKQGVLREKFIGKEEEIDVLCPNCGTKHKGHVEEEEEQSS